MILDAPFDGFRGNGDAYRAAELDDGGGLAAVVHGQANADVHAAGLRPHAVRYQHLRQETHVLCAVVVCNKGGTILVRSTWRF